MTLADDNRIEAVRPAFTAMGATIVAGGFTFGKYDVVAVYEAPDDVTAGALSLAIAAGGATRSASTTRLLSGEEWTESLTKASGSQYELAGADPVHHRLAWWRNGRSAASARNGHERAQR